MNFFSSFHRVLVGFFSFILMLASGLSVAAQQPTPGVVAELWPLERLATDSPRRAFEILRSQAPKSKATTLPLDQFEIPARETPSLVRVRGVLTAPEAHGYTFTIDGGDDAELWMEDEAGDWNLVQREGNPIKREGAVPMKPEAPRRFEFWTMGSAKMSVQWESTKWETKDKSRLIVNETIAASRMQAPEQKGGGPNEDGLRAGWKQSQGLDLSSNDGPNGMWGDPDGDGLPNWQEQKVGTHPLKADADGHAGLARWEIWRNIPGQYVFDLTRSANYPDKPDEVRYLHRLQTPVGYGENYGARVSGWIKAPASGEYTFMLIGDDTAELWLGETESRQSRKLIAKVEQEGVPGKWTRRSEQVEKPLFPEQVSAPISLEQGKSYYVEILHKQLNRRDHCTAAWVVPGATSPQVIGADALVSPRNLKEELHDEKLPEDWLKAVGLLAPEIDPAMRAASADPDHDGLTNWEEWKAGTDPLKPDAREAKNVQHRLTCELWDSLPGSRLKDLTPHSQYPSKPTHTTLVDNLDFSDEGGDYGVRLRGYLTAPEDGPYVFSISGNDACTLWLAESADKFTKHPIAETTRGTGWRAYGRSASQQSESIVLKKGRQYYVEVLFKRGARPKTADAPRDHASVAWNRPGRPRTVIGADYFSPYQPDKRDADDDDLPDEWEKAHGLDPNDATGANGAWGDPDGDLLENFREFQAGLDPKSADVHGAPGFAIWECWENIQGDLTALRNHPSFPLHPTQRVWLNKLEGPQGLGNFYGSRLRAYLVPPATGDYQLAIAGDNQCELWVSATELKYAREKVAFVKRWTGYREWHEEPGQISRPIHLEAGKRYFIEALHHQATIGDHVSVAWKVPGAKDFEVIRGQALAGFARDPNDLGDDDLPDDWEKANGLSPSSPNGDQDLDGDGLTNREEFLLGTRADKADTDGDGLNDGDEVRLYHSDPLRKDAVAPVRLTDLPLAYYQAKPGNWFQMPNGSLHSMVRRGAVDFTFDLEKPGIYLVELQAVAHATGDYTPPIPVIARVDGAEIGRAEVKAGGSRHHWLTSWLPAGKHTVTIDDRNVRTEVSLEISSLTLYQHEGADVDGNGTPDWLDQLFQRDNRFEVGPSESATSPACLEGIARFPADARISGPEGEIPTQAGLAGHWFANLPLDPAGETKITGSFENGSLHEEHTIRWLVTNLFGAPDTLRVRVGDSLRITAVPTGVDGQKTAAKFTLDGEALGDGPAAEPRVVKFEKPGTFTLAASAATGQETLETSVQVEVVAADFGPVFSVAVGAPRVWDLPSIPRSLVLDADPGLGLEELDRQPLKSRRVTVSYPDRQSGSPRVLARLWKDGPIAAATSVNAFWFVPATATGNYQVIQTLPDGTRVVEVRYVIDGPIPPDLSIWLQMDVTDAVFANGDTSHELTAADFDASGEARLLIYKAPGTNIPFVCHWIRPYFKDLPAK